MHRSQRELASRADRPEPAVLEDLAHRVDAEDAVLVRDQRRHLGRLVGVVLLLLGIQEVLLLEDRVQLAEGLEDRQPCSRNRGRRGPRAGSRTRAGAQRCRRGRCRCPCSGRSCRSYGRNPRKAGCRRRWSASRRQWRFHRSCERQRAWSWAGSGEREGEVAAAREPRIIPSREPGSRAATVPGASPVGGSSRGIPRPSAHAQNSRGRSRGVRSFGQRLPEKAPGGNERRQRVRPAAARRPSASRAFHPRR